MNLIHDGIPVRSFRARRWFVALLGVALVGLGGAATLPALSGRTESPRFSLEAAQAAVRAAREAGASRWAPQMP